nr:hypothetical protein [Pseudomonas umsongensis]
MLYSPGEPRQGSTESHETLIDLVRLRFPRKPYCLVEKWTVFQVDVTAEQLTSIHAAGQLPLILFAHNVIFDSERRFDVGDWVRTSMCISLDESVFETRNTVYVLLGAGYEKSVTLKEILSFF